MATNGQFYWPPAGNSVAAYGQLVTAADNLPHANWATETKLTATRRVNLPGPIRDA